VGGGRRIGASLHDGTTRARTPAAFRFHCPPVRLSVTSARPSVRPPFVSYLTPRARARTYSAAVNTRSRATDRPRRRRRDRQQPEIITDPSASAQAAGLHYVSDTRPGIVRKRRGKGFVYIGPDGKPVRDAATLARIRRLAIPPAYTDVWICPDPEGHLQATGRDARGRKQYRYHARWREVRDETKFERMVAFSEALPAMRGRIERDLALPGLPRDKVLAAIVQLLECTAIRVGNDEYARTNRSFGLTTLKDHHVEIAGARLRFEFRGKSGKIHTVDVTDRRLARIVARCQSIPGEELFQYVDDDGERQTVDSGDVNDYIRRISGQDFTAKDFRTWAGTMLAVDALREVGPFASQREAKSKLLAAVDRVAEQLNNTRAVCRKYYIHPAVVEIYLAGRLIEELAVLPGTNGKAAGNGKGVTRLPVEESEVLELIRRAPPPGRN
jgi:DNA topoisomerase-1